MANTTGKKFGGRRKGTPNRLTSEVRSALKRVLHDEIEELPVLLKNLDAKNRVDVLVKLLPFVAPKVKEVSATSDEPIQSTWLL